MTETQSWIVVVELALIALAALLGARR